MINLTYSVFLGLLFSVTLGDGVPPERRQNCGYILPHLPPEIFPQSYRIEIDAPPMTLQYTGKVGVDIKLLSGKDNQIVFHAHPSLGITGIQANLLDEHLQTRIDIDIATACHDTERGLIVVILDPTSRLSGERRLHSLGHDSFRFRILLEFMGPIKQDPSDFGLIRIKGANSFPVTYSRIERYKARYLFPCYDEPRYISKIRFILISRPGFKAIFLTNTKHETVDYATRNRIIEFLPCSITPDAVTFAIGDFARSAPSSILRSIIFWPRGEELNKVDKLNSFVEEAYQHNGSLFGFEEGSFKLLVILLPGIGQHDVIGKTFIISDLQMARNAFNPTKKTLRVQAALKLVGNIVATYINSMLVRGSPLDLWLFEGLKLWLTYRIKSVVGEKYEFRIDHLRTINKMAMELDAETNSRPIYPPNEETFQYLIERENLFFDPDNDQPDGPFDEFARTKSFGIIRMINDSCGVERFKNVIYQLGSKRGKIVRTGDFIKAVLQACEWNPSDIILDMLMQPGYPVVKLSLSSEGLIAEQRKFHSDVTQDNLVDREWNLPVTLFAGTHDSQISDARVLLVDKAYLFEIPMDINKVWIKANRHFDGFYRVIYSKELVSRLNVAINQISNLDQLNILEDAIALFKAGYVDIDYLIQVLRMLKNINNEWIQSSMVEAYAYLKRLSVATPSESVINQLGIELFAEIFEKYKMRAIGLMSDDGVNGRKMIYSILVCLGYEPILDWVRKNLIHVRLYTNVVEYNTLVTALLREGFEGEYSTIKSTVVSQSFPDPEYLETSAALSNIPMHLLSAWTIIKSNRPEKAFSFIHNSLLTSHGRNLFAIMLVSETETLVQLLGFEGIRILISEYCASITDQDKCESNSKLAATIGDNDKWNLITLAIESARRRYELVQPLSSEEMIQ